jgi:hypothetical protein
MRHILLLVAAGCILQQMAWAQGHEPAEQQTVTPNDRLAASLWRIAASTNTKIGFEATDHTQILTRLERVPPLAVSTLEEGLNAAIGADDRYEWRRVDDVVVVRPKRAWNDPSNLFNRRMRNVQVANAASIGVLVGLRDFAYTDKFAVVPKSTTEMPVSFQVQSGTVVDVLNTLMIAADQVLWIGSYRPVGQPAERFPRWDFALQMMGPEHLCCYTGGHRPRRQ